MNLKINPLFIKMHYKLLVVTVTYKSVEFLPEFIHSFNKFNDIGEDARLIVVDNSPSDYKKIDELVNTFGEVDYLTQSHNPGFGASNNFGFDHYSSDYVLFINNDVEFVMPLFKSIISLHEENERLGCVGINQTGGSPSYFKKINSTLKGSNSKFVDADHFISGAFMFFKSCVFKEIGKFDSKLFMYGEEQDLSFRLINSNYYTEYISKLTFLHKSGDRKKLSKFSWETSTKSFCYLYLKYNIDHKIPERILMTRIKKLMIYFFMKVDFKEVLKLYQVYVFRKKYVTNFFHNHLISN